MLTDHPAVDVTLKHSPDPAKVPAQPITEKYLADLAVDDPDVAGKKFTIGAEIQALGDAAKPLDQGAMAAVHKRLFAWDLAVSRVIEDAIYKVQGNRMALRRIIRGVV